MPRRTWFPPLLTSLRPLGLILTPLPPSEPSYLCSSSSCTGLSMAAYRENSPLSDFFDVLSLR